ncbi:hypothetical protein QQ045_011096 [Rhodiola kirilowii]
MTDSKGHSFTTDSPENDQSGGRSLGSGEGSGVSEPVRNWRDVFWLLVFVVHLILLALGLVVDWPFYAVAGSGGAAIGWAWLLFLGSRAIQMMKVSVHILTTYLAVISVLCFWSHQFFWWGVVFAVWAGPVSFVKQFKYKVIKQATVDFRRVLYSNAHGTAYRAVLCGGSFALVKDIREWDQDAEVFYREVQLIGRLHHCHILLLIGFSTEHSYYVP